MSHKTSMYHYADLVLAKLKMGRWLGLGQGRVKLWTWLLGLMLMSCSQVFYQPIQGALVAPERLTQTTPEEVWLNAPGAVRLHAWIFRASEKPRGTILFFHGNAENMSTHFLNLWWLVKEGYDLLAFDYRGYGFSSGTATAAGVHADALVAMEWAFTDQQQRQSPLLIVYGQSLGGAIAARALYDFSHKSQVDLLVQDSTFASYQKIAASKIRSFWPLWPLFPLAYVVVSDEYAADKVLAKLKVPVLGIHSLQDPVVGYEQGLAGHQLVTARKWWWPVKHAGHSEAFHFPGTPYRQRFLKLLTQLQSGKNLP